MKKLLLVSALLILGCSGDDDSNSSSGCTDSLAVNYDVDATQDDGSCMYSIIGDWTVLQYTLSDGTNVMDAYDYIDYTMYSDNSFIQYIGPVGTNDEIIITGTYSISGSNNSTLTFSIDEGPTTPSTIVSINSTTIELTFDVINTNLTADLTLIRF